MPCYNPPITYREEREMHEHSALRILKNLHISSTSGPDAVRRLCDWCKKSTTQAVKKAGAYYWYEDHKEHDLRQSGLAKLTDAEKAALGVRDQDEA